MSVSHKKQLFDIVHFIGDKDKKSIDCVPSTWIFFDQEMRQLRTTFMPPPYTTKKCNDLHKLVQNLGIAPNKWPSYSVNILGSTGTVLLLSKARKYQHANFQRGAYGSFSGRDNAHNQKLYMCTAPIFTHMHLSTVYVIPSTTGTISSTS